MIKFVMMPPQDELKQWFATRLAEAMPAYKVVVPASDEEAKEEIRDADAAFGWIPPDALAVATKLRWLQNPDSGPFVGYFYPELIEHPVVVANPRGIYFDHISHHIMMFVLALARGLPWYIDAQYQRVWDKEARKSPYIDLTAATVLIVGVGGVGHETARLCQQFGMTVLGIDPRPEYDLPNVAIHPPQALDTLLPQADFVIVTTPHTPETEGMWNADRFARMKNTAYFINIGRGKTMKIDDLTEAIESGQIGGCGLDVYEVEPLPVDHKLWRLPNVLLTPHIAVRDAANLPERRFQVLLENARRFDAGEPLKNTVDKALWY
ncbi:D-2-hydroxyacid dehydrogenase [Chloroflexi bacterium TSY]|nr:D-2-hydroxyacid dehydrogenase [Chloroflexi bacterium TSY]